MLNASEHLEQEKLINLIHQQLSTELGDKAMTLIERSRREGQEERYMQGREDGLSQGLSKGLSQG